MNTAVALADADGLDVVTMRAVAQRLGYRVMSLYNHVAGKSDLLEEMVDAALSDVDPPPHENWRSEIVAVATELNAALRVHHWAPHLWPQTFPGPHRWRIVERVLTALTAAGIPEERADLGFHLIINHVVGFSHLQVGYATAQFTESAGRARFLQEVNAQNFPHMDAHARFHSGDARDERPDEFLYVLDLILDSLAG